MRIKINKQETLEELYRMRTQEEAAHEKAMAEYEYLMAGYIYKVQEELRRVLQDIENGTFDPDKEASGYHLHRSGITVEVNMDRPEKPYGVSYLLERTIAMLERHKPTELSIDENHEVIKLLVPRPR